MPFHRRLLRSIAKDGIGATLLRPFERLGRSLRRVFRASPAIPPVDPQLVHPFDRLHGTDTSGLIRGGKLVFDLPTGLYKAVYLGISPSTLMHALSELKIPHEEFTFVDIGCGKGRALLVAARFPFARLLGVELSPELCAVARANLALEPRVAQRATVLTHDATTLVFPDTPLVLFFYDPFTVDMLTRFLANLERQLRSSPRETYLLYAANRHAAAMAACPFLRLVYEVQIPLSAEDAAIDQLSYDLQFPPLPGDDPAVRRRITHEHYTLHRVSL